MPNTAQLDKINSVTAAIIAALGTGWAITKRDGWGETGRETWNWWTVTRAADGMALHFDTHPGAGRMEVYPDENGSRHKLKTTFATDRDPAALARVIQRKVIEPYEAIYAAKVARIAQEALDAAARAAATRTLTATLAPLGPREGRSDSARNEISLYQAGGFSGGFTVKTKDCDIELRYVPHALALKIAALIASDK